MPQIVDETDTSEARAKLGKCVVPSMLCFPKEAGKHEATLISTARDKKENRIKTIWTTWPKKRFVSEFHFDLGHKPISIKESMKIPEDSAAEEELRNLPTWNLRKVKPKAELVRQPNNDGISAHFASVVNLCHLKQAELAKHLQRKNGTVVLGEATSRTTTDTKECSLNMAHQLRRWQRQDFWHGERSDRRGIRTHPTWRKLPDVQDYGRRMLPRMDTATTQSKTERLGYYFATIGSSRTKPTGSSFGRIAL